ncbi:MAG: GPW/gp25 family protein [Lewinellaceae bacterium]|nr:GPW/gp25 family protein [Phaeodactylibacter sp.]MCB0611916.1 GPW/gp25 family protein [Phaeodactylibacter sp.]MCB9349635.1 GPW/gp25 family protein [Lewinellaceae bacterium]
MNPPITAIRFPFAVDGGLGALAEENSYDAHVVQLIKQVLFTGPGERINRPDFGCGLRRMVFAPNSDATANLTRVAIVQALEKWLGSVLKAEEVTVQVVDERLEVKLVYILKARQERRYLNLEIEL